MYSTKLMEGREDCHLMTISSTGYKTLRHLYMFPKPSSWRIIPRKEESRISRDLTQATAKCVTKWIKK